MTDQSVELNLGGIIDEEGRDDQWQCKQCGKKGGFELLGNGRVRCEGCRAEHFVPVGSGNPVLIEQDADKCPRCKCKKLFVSKELTQVYFRCLRCQWEWSEELVSGGLDTQ